MPFYFFDILHGEILTVDEEGSDLPDFEQALREAVETLLQVARERLQGGKHRLFSTTVYDENRKVVYVATLMFHERQLIIL